MNGVAIRFCSVSKYSLCGGLRGHGGAWVHGFAGAAAFFITYEYVKWFLHTDSSSYLMPVKHMLAASAGEVVACLIRVPSEVVKQRAQVSSSSRTFQIFSNVLYQEGIRGLYRGYTSTVLREIPFSLVQFPLWESLKVDLQLWSPRLWMWQKQGSCWQRLVPAPLVGMCSLPCTGSGGHRGWRDYLQVSSLERQPSVWEASSFLVLMTKPAACYWNLAEGAPESRTAPHAPLSRKGAAVRTGSLPVSSCSPI
ncbi:S-adenosylmethionine mitochondrial carrier protein isoform X4 [Panthera pardus]|uniref:Mitochondrial S-adenosylmethionine carrier protein n=1 Tax=Panthera pardus TaxID=9691 RepID=A0A9W2V4A2_PANPR|nr:S-adenosylmethionine mitochondrial carrier protein isoform X4 [Panthera pardus]